MSRAALLFLCLLPSLTCASATIDDLLAEDSLRLRTWLEPADAIAVGQEVALVIEVSTPRWFAGGTKIRPPEVAGLVVLRRDEFATNLSRREGGNTWVIQQWRLELYPQRQGSFTVPPVQLELAVNHAEAGIVRGRLSTDALHFEARVPPGLQDVKTWLATPSLTMEQRFDRDPAGLAPGDALTRTVAVTATDIAAMMIPSLPVQETEGLAAYPDTPELEDRSNRGKVTATRRETITYVIEHPGQYRLPELVLTWWNTGAGRVETARLPAVVIDAGGTLQAAGAPTAITRIPAWYGWLPALLLAATAALFAIRRLIGDRPLSRARAALKRGDAASAAAAVYAWLNTREGNWLSLRQRARDVGAEDAAEGLLRAGYAEEGGATGNTGALLRQLRRRPRRQRRQRNLSLNPVDRQPRK